MRKTNQRYLQIQNGRFLPNLFPNAQRVLKEAKTKSSDRRRIQNQQSLKEKKSPLAHGRLLSCLAVQRNLRLILRYHLWKTEVKSGFLSRRMKTRKTRKIFLKHLRPKLMKRNSNLERNLQKRPSNLLHPPNPPQILALHRLPNRQLNRLPSLPRSQKLLPPVNQPLHQRMPILLKPRQPRLSL